MKIDAHAHAEKRLFISLLTRDISLADAFLDLIDNSINAALKAVKFGGDTSEDYVTLLNSDAKPRFNIKVNFTPSSVRVEDNCGGISASDAASDVFVFGAPDPESHSDDRLSVYGIGLKRAIFKLGKKIDMLSEHPDGGFSLDLRVPVWEASTKQPWTFEIEQRPSLAKGRTEIVVTEIHSAVAARISDPAFETDLVTRISRAYSFFVSRIVTIEVNGHQISPVVALVSSNRASDSFQIEDVSISITAGLGAPRDKKYVAELAGWTVFCNGRAVIFFDKSQLTGWGVEGYLPSFQPKHRPFVGMVFFTSSIPEHLPWTTTKLGVNTDNIVWQRTLKRMADVGRQVTRFLDNRYSEEGTSISMDELSDVIGSSDKVSVAIADKPKIFEQPRRKSPPTTSVQYHVGREKISQVKSAIGRRTMSNSEVGRYTFDYFFENEVDDG